MSTLSLNPKRRRPYIKPIRYKPGMTIGILGAGQLGRMLALAGYPLGMRFRFLDPNPESPAGRLGEHIVGDYSDEAALRRFVKDLDLVTYEFENVPVETALWLDERVRVFPPPAALEVSQDRLIEKQFFNKLGIPTAPFAPVDSLAELEAAVAQLGLPAVLKTRRFGYDGKGQLVIKTQEEIVTAWEALGGVPLILEGFVKFDRELSIITARTLRGSGMPSNLVENTHRDGILRKSIAPIKDLGLGQIARNYMRNILNDLNYVGVAALELFQVGDTLLANEMAPRVHNSGHWTIEGALTSQFKAHLLAPIVQDIFMPHRGYSAMINIIGELPNINQLIKLQEVYVHLYDKEPRPGRKLGHITVKGFDPEALAARLDNIRPFINE